MTHTAIAADEPDPQRQHIVPTTTAPSMPAVLAANIASTGLPMSRIDVTANVYLAPGDHLAEPGTREHFALLAEARHASTAHIIPYFAWSHLPEHLRAVSAKFGMLTVDLLGLLPDGPELTAALRKLLEAKDCAVRAALDAQP